MTAGGIGLEGHGGVFARKPNGSLRYPAPVTNSLIHATRRIWGDAGNDVVAGKLGNDTLYGGRDKDAFVFDTKANKTTNVDRIVDFNVSDDSIWLGNAVFKGLGSKGTLTKPVQLSSKMFWSGTKAHDKDDRVIYDKKSGALYYDADGTGSAAQVKIAALSKNLKMTYKDFFVV